MRLGFTSNLFGVNDGDDQSVFGTENTPTFDTVDNQWKMDCELGSCGMEVISEKMNSVT